MYRHRYGRNKGCRWLLNLLFNILLNITTRFDIRALGGELAAGVAKLGQRRWDEVPVSMSSQVQILPSAPKNEYRLNATDQDRRSFLAVLNTTLPLEVILCCQTTSLGLKTLSIFSLLQCLLASNSVMYWPH